MKNAFLAIGFLLFSFCQNGGSNDIKLIEIEGSEAITVADFNLAYSTTIEKLKNSLGLTDEQLKELSNRSREEVQAMSPQIQQVWMQLNKEAFLDDYKRRKIVNRKARDDGFINREDVKKKIQFYTEQAIMELYLIDNIKAPKFSDTEIENECKRIKEQYADNPQVKAMTAMMCLEQASNSLKQGSQQKELALLMKSITEGYRVQEFKSAVDKYVRGADSAKDGMKNDAGSDKPKKKKKKKNKSE